MSVPAPSIADLLEATNRELAGTDARVYRRVGTHLQRTAQAIEELKGPSTLRQRQQEYPHRCRDR
jgi:hypothetical protein